MGISPYYNIKKTIVEAVSAAVSKLGYEGFAAQDISDSVDLSRNFGDISTSIALRIAKSKSLDANAVSESIAKSAILPSGVKSVYAKNGFVNFEIERNSYSKVVIESVASDKSYFSTNLGAGEKAIIEYPSINPAHPMHMGQVRNVLLGDSIANIFSLSGFNAEREDYIDDLGLQVAEVIWGLTHLEKLGITFDKDKKFDHMIGEVYVEVNKKMKEFGIEAEIKEILVRMEQDGTYEAGMAREMAESFVRAEYETITGMGIYHDVLVWESDIVRGRLLEKSLELMAQKSITSNPKEGEYAGCVVIEHSKLSNMQSGINLGEGSKVLVRSNGAPDYVAKDIAFHMWKLGILENSFKYSAFMEQGEDKRVLYSTASEGVEKDFGGAKIAINTIDVRQSYEQNVVRLAIQLIGGNKFADSIKHIAYGVVELESGSLSGRQGTWMGYTCDDLVREATEKALKLITERFSMDESEKKSIAKDIALSAIKYEFLKLSNEKKLVFSWDRALNFEGNSGPYCEYTYARSERILENAGISGSERWGIPENYEVSDEEFQLIKQMSYAKEILEKAARESKPNIIIEYMSSLATSFSKFYEKIPILKAEGTQRQARLSITYAFNSLMAQLMMSLGIKPIKKM